MVEQGEKQRVLKKLLADADVDRTIVFTKTNNGANRLSQNLQKSGFRSVAIHGNKTQSARQKALAALRETKLRVLLVATMSPRGTSASQALDVNYDLPHEPESYVRRIGRTGRLGAEVEAVSSCLPDEKRELRACEKLSGKKANVSMPIDEKQK